MFHVLSDFCWIMLPTEFKHATFYRIFGFARLYMSSEGALRCRPRTGKNSLW